MTTGRESDKFMLRLPDGMRDRIKAAADANNRSMNAEIVATLEEMYPEPASDWSLSEVDLMIRHIVAAKDRADYWLRLEAANARLAPSGARLAETIGPLGRPELTLRTKTQTAEIVAGLSWGDAFETEEGEQENNDRKAL